MKFSLRNIFLLAMLMLIVLLTAGGCGQKDDIIKATDTTTLTLRPNNLPVLQEIYIYELWAAKIDGSDSEFVSLGQFVWDRELFLFRDTSGNKISNEYVLPETWQYYTHIYVSIENRGVSHLNPSGSFMLAVETGPVNDINPIYTMEFPVSMFPAVGLWYVATPTDDSLNRFNEDKGLWLGSRAMTQRYLHDTLDINGINQILIPIDTPYTADDSASWLVLDTIWADFPITEVESLKVVYGLDTLPHRRINVNWSDTLDSFNNYLLFVDYEIDSISFDRSAPLGLIQYFDYNPALDGLPDVRPFGFRYNAWVLSEYFPDAADMPQMVPFGYDLPEALTGDTTFRVVSLGAFYRPDSADLSNPYLNNLEVPNYPGEDFINGILPAGYNNISFRYSGVDTTSGIWGSIVVGLEPDPANLTIDSTRNFPLFFLSSQLPHAFDPGSNAVQVFHNWNQYMPKIALTVKFSE